MSDTPRMEAALLDAPDAGFSNIWRVGCDIERELNAANERIKRLEEVGDALAKTQTYDLLETVNWRKAKEAKLRAIHRGRTLDSSRVLCSMAVLSNWIGFTPHSLAHLSANSTQQTQSSGSSNCCRRRTCGYKTGSSGWMTSSTERPASSSEMDLTVRLPVEC